MNTALGSSLTAGNPPQWLECIQDSLAIIRSKGLSLRASRRQ